MPLQPAKSASAAVVLAHAVIGGGNNPVPFLWVIFTDDDVERGLSKIADPAQAAVAFVLSFLTPHPCRNGIAHDFSRRDAATVGNGFYFGEDRLVEAQGMAFGTGRHCHPP